MRSGWGVGSPEQPSAVLGFIASWLNSIHIYVFAFVSGYIFFYLKYERKRYNNLIKDTLHRAKQLLVPYVVASVIWVIPMGYLFFKYSVKDIIKNYLLAISPSQLWFLVMLFTLFVVFYLFSDLLEKHNLLVGIIICGAFYAIGLLGNILVPNVLQIWTAFKYFVFYYMGFAFRKYKDNFLYQVPWFVWLGLNIAAFSLNYWFVSLQDGKLFGLISMGLSPLASVFGVLAVATAVAGIDVSKVQQNSVYNFLEKHNFVVYLLHQQLIYVTLFVLNGKIPAILLMMINLVFALSLSLAVAYIISKIPKVRGLFNYKEE